jgi:RNA-binding protein YlmH
MEKGKLLDRIGAGGDERLVLARVLDKLEQTERHGAPACTDFLSPQEQASAKDLLRAAGVPETSCLFFGGYDGAERKLLQFLPDWLAPENAEFPLRCLRASFRSEFALTHRDILGSLMGLGIVREKVGDLLVGNESCDLIVRDSVAEFLLENWKSAGRAGVSVAAVDSAELRVPEVKYEEIRDTVQTLRLDSVAAAGFHLSRGRAAALIGSGKVQVNWRECVKPDRALREGDAVSARGFGKLVVAQVGGVTRKGRTAIVLKRLI